MCDPSKPNIQFASRLQCVMPYTPFFNFYDKHCQEYPGRKIKEGMVVVISTQVPSTMPQCSSAKFFNQVFTSSQWQGLDGGKMEWKFVTATRGRHGQVLMI